MSAAGHRCWVCDGVRLDVAKRGDLARDLESRDFAITDAHYGRTGEIHECADCGFLQCSEQSDVLGFYESLVDEVYDETRGARALQARRLLQQIRPPRPGGRLLDVGAGSGILVAQATELGYRAEGVEPSAWLQRRAVERGLAVELGTLPHPQLGGPYDVVTLIDVVEHVPDPVGLLERAREVTAPDGVVAVVTPDVGSLAARLLGWRWWHFRVAHVGYFSTATLKLALQRAGLGEPRLSRPGWYFPADYLVERVNTYLPRVLRVPAPRWLGGIRVPLNLRDSLLAIATPSEAGR